MFKKYLITILLVGVVILSSCKSTASSTEEDTTTEVITTLAGTHWKLQSINGVNLLPNSYISLYFRDQQALGYSGCNRYGGQYTEEPDGKLQLSNVAYTLIGCAKEINDQEDSYYQALGKTAGYSFKDHKLTINDASGQALLVFIKLPEYAGDPAQLMNIDEKMTISGTDGPFYFEDTFQAKDGNLTGTGQMAKRVSDTTTSDEPQSFKVTGALSYVANYRLINGQLQLFSMRGDADTIILVPSK